MPVVASVPQWVQDWGVYLGVIGAFFAVVAGIWAFTRVVTNGIVKGVDIVFDTKLEDKVPALVAPILDARLGPIIERQALMAEQVADINHAVNNVPKGSPTLLARVTDAQVLATHAVETAENTAEVTRKTLERIEVNQVTHLLDKGVDPAKIVMPDSVDH